MSNTDMNSGSSFAIVDALDKMITTEMSDAINTYLTEKEAVKIGALPLAIRSFITFGEKLMLFPTVGTDPRPGNTRGKGYKGNNPDYYMVVKPGKKKDRDTWRSHTQDFAERSPVGLAIASELEACKDAAGKTPVGKYAALGTAELDATAGKWRQRMSGNTNLWRNALQIVQRIADIGACDKVAVRVFTTPVKPPEIAFLMPVVSGAPWIGGEYLMPTPFPFAIYDRLVVGGVATNANERAIAISELIAMDVAAAGGEKNATVATLRKSAQRGTQEEGTELEENIKANAKGLTLFEGYLDEQVAALSNDRFLALMYTRLNQIEGEDLLTALWQMHKHLGRVFGKAKLRDKAMDLDVAQQEAAGEAAQPGAQEAAA